MASETRIENLVSFLGPMLAPRERRLEEISTHCGNHVEGGSRSNLESSHGNFRRSGAGRVKALVNVGGDSGRAPPFADVHVMH